MPQRDILAMTRCTGWLRSLMYFAWRQMARNNPTWGQGRIANEPLLMLGLRVLKTPSRCPQANTICERGLGTRRRDALDFVMPLIANHLRRMWREWVVHDNQDCPHMSLGPGMGCVFGIVSLRSWIEDLGAVGRHHLHRLAEIVSQ
jgi:hypothetical protein